MRLRRRRRSGSKSSDGNLLHGAGRQVPHDDLIGGDNMRDHCLAAACHDTIADGNVYECHTPSVAPFP